MRLIDIEPTIRKEHNLCLDSHDVREQKQNLDGHRLPSTVFAAQPKRRKFDWRHKGEKEQQKKKKKKKERGGKNNK